MHQSESIGAKNLHKSSLEVISSQKQRSRVGSNDRRSRAGFARCETMLGMMNADELRKCRRTIDTHGPRKDQRLRSALTTQEKRGDREHSTTLQAQKMRIPRS